eukprot:TRINITY_DN6016_c0_g1_i1.p1 TRINITY_DN6016_c0_g1~~TRINITY_DN6016_c0_g1_i1.p1  ORF type:complete len:669 (+),score=115.23 TRINITY_DN6016_c0_g1_i1:235-2007(+)
MPTRPPQQIKKKPTPLVRRKYEPQKEQKIEPPEKAPDPTDDIDQEEIIKKQLPVLPPTVEQQTEVYIPELEQTNGPIDLSSINFEEIKNNRKKQREAVRSALRHAWNGYEKLAFGHDELRPVTNQTNDSWGGYGVTLVDALDTLLVTDLADEFERAREHVKNIKYVKNYDASFFETSIRHLGGLLGAEALTGDELFQEKAKELADRLLFAFNSTTGVAFSIVNLETGSTRNPRWSSESSILSEFGSVQLEFATLSHLLGDGTYNDKAQRVYEVLDVAPKKNEGLYPVYFDPISSRFTTDLISFGSLGDSFYEYLLKQWLLTGKKDEAMRRRYEASIEGLSKFMVGEVTSLKGDLTYSFVGEYSGDSLRPSMDHLICYLPGTLALGSQHLPNQETRQKHLQLALRLLKTCLGLYAGQPTGIGPERASFSVARDRTTPANSLQDEMSWWQKASEEPASAYLQLKENGPTHRVESGRYLLRPEVIESLWAVHRATGFEFCQHFGWKIFESIVRYCQTPSSFSGLVDVTKSSPSHDNSMQSFFFAETLKYLYLLFSDNSEMVPIYGGKVIRMDEFVFNTEAHFLRKTDSQREVS